MPRARTPSPRSNRTDLLQPVPGQTYGKVAEQTQAQRVVPAASAPSLPAAQPPGGAPAAPSPQAPPGNPLAMLDAHNSQNMPPPLVRPSDRPNEPVTHGLPSGPGAGPEALTGVGAAARDGAVETGTLSHLLGNMAAQPNAPTAIRDMAALAGTGAL